MAEKVYVLCKMNPETWAALVGAVAGGLIGLAGVWLQARVTDRKDRESHLTAFHAFLARWRNMLEREMQRDLVHNEKNVLNYKDNLPEFDRQAVIIERDLAPESREQFRKLIVKAGSYRDSDIERQTRDKKLEILSDIDEMLSLVGQSRP